MSADAILYLAFMKTWGKHSGEVDTKRAEAWIKFRRKHIRNL